MKYSALIGNPTGHSVSHIMYEELANAAGLKDTYKHLKIDVKAEALPLVLSSFKQLDFVGINVTLPYKMEVMKYLDKVDETVNVLGAVNTVKFGADTIGYNTDWIGLTTPLLKKIANNKIRSVAIFGTGGAARAAIYAATQIKANEIIVLYRASHTQDLGDLKTKAEAPGITLLDYSHVKDVVAKANIIINATSAGMVGKDAAPFDLELLDDINLKDKLFFDAVFNPTLTPLLKYFNSRSATTIDGLWMMIYQGISALSIWLDIDINIADQELIRIHNLLEESINHA